MRKPAPKFKVQVIIEPDGNGFHAYCPALKGLHTLGETVEETKKNAKNAVIAYIESLIDEGDPIPVGIIDIPSVDKKPMQTKSEYYVENVALV